MKHLGTKRKLIIIHPDPEDVKAGDVVAGNYHNGYTYNNLTYAWEKTKCFNKFVLYFSKVEEHETLHYLIDKELHRKCYPKRKITYTNEDYIVRKLTHEKFGKDKRKYYEKQDKRSK